MLECKGGRKSLISYSIFGITQREETGKTLVEEAEMKLFLIVCSWFGINVRCLRVWIGNQKIRFFHSRTRKCEAFLKLYQDRRPMTYFRQTLWKIRYDRWAVEMALWTDRDLGIKMLKEAAKEHWAWKKRYYWGLRMDLALRARIAMWHSSLKYALRPNNLKKKLYRRLKRMPAVCITSHNGLTAVVLQRDLKRAKKIFVGYTGYREEEQFIVGGNYGDQFVPQRTMIFAKPTTQSFALRKPATEIATGTPSDMKELLQGCVVHTFPRGSFFVPYSSYRQLLDWQREQFSPVSLAEAYRLVWGNRRKPPVVTTSN